MTVPIYNNSERFGVGVARILRVWQGRGKVFFVLIQNPPPESWRSYSNAKTRSDRGDDDRKNPRGRNLDRKSFPNRKRPAIG